MSAAFTTTPPGTETRSVSDRDTSFSLAPSTTASDLTDNLRRLSLEDSAAPRSPQTDTASMVSLPPARSLKRAATSTSGTEEVDVPQSAAVYGPKGLMRKDGRPIRSCMRGTRTRGSTASKPPTEAETKSDFETKADIETTPETADSTAPPALKRKTSRVDFTPEVKTKHDADTASSRYRTTCTSRPSRRSHLNAPQSFNPAQLAYLRLLEQSQQQSQGGQLSPRCVWIDSIAPSSHRTGETQRTSFGVAIPSSALRTRMSSGPAVSVY